MLNSIIVESETKTQPETEKNSPLQDRGRLRTKRQWRKQRLRIVRKGEKPVDFHAHRYMAYRRSEEIAVDGCSTVTKTPVVKERRIALYSFDQTYACKKVGVQLLRDQFGQYFVDDASKEVYVWWDVEENHWVWCRNGWLDDEAIKRHLKGEDVYGVIGGDDSRFSAIDADYHGGDYEIFKAQLTLLLKNLHGRNRWHYSISARGCHLIRTHEQLPTAQVRAALRKLLTDIDAQDPELRTRAIAAEMKPISDWEIYPDPKQAFRLPLARSRTMFLDRLYESADLETYVKWQMRPLYCPLDDALAAIFSVIVPVSAEDVPAATPAQQKTAIVGKSPRQTSQPERVFGNLRGRYTQVLVDFWTGNDNPPDSLNCGIAITARMMPYYYDDPADAIDLIEELIAGLPTLAFSDRLSSGKRAEVTSIVRHTVQAVYDGNGHQSHSALSTSKLDRVFTAWQAKGFSLIDRSTWSKYTAGLICSPVDSFNWATEDVPALTYFAEILKTDLQTTANVTRHFLCLLQNHPTGEMSVRYVKELLSKGGVKCGHHGKVSEFLNALSQAGWITEIDHYAIGRKGRCWQVGPKMAEKFISSSSNNKTPSPIYIWVPFSQNREEEPVINGQFDGAIGEERSEITTDDGFGDGKIAKTVHEAEVLFQSG